MSYFVEAHRKVINMRVTHKQIADSLGVSRTLVTTVLHGSGRFPVKEETRNLIEKAAREMGYSPRNVTTHAVGYLMPTGHLRSQVDQEVVIAIEAALRRRGYRLTVITSDQPGGMTLEDVVNTKTVDGILLAEWEDGRFESLLTPQIPYVLLSEEEVGSHVERVCVDLKGTARNILEHLRDYGHDRILNMVGDTAKPFYRHIDQAFAAAGSEMAWPGLQLNTVMLKAAMEAGDYLVDIMRQPGAPTAVVVPDKERIFSLYGSLLTAGYRIPQDISLISMFDSHDFFFTKPAMSATDAGTHDVAVLAVERLMTKINMPETIPHHQSIAGKLVERGSVGPAPVKAND